MTELVVTPDEFNQLHEAMVMVSPGEQYLAVERALGKEIAEAIRYKQVRVVVQWVGGEIVHRVREALP